VRERIEYRFRVPSAAVFTLYSYFKALEYRFRVPTAGSLKAAYSGSGKSFLAILAHNIAEYRPVADATGQARVRVGERARTSVGPTCSTIKNVITHKQKIKLNSDCTIKFVLINSSKLDFT
jgi:hypothetical protein